MTVFAVQCFAAINTAMPFMCFKGELDKFNQINCFQILCCNFG